VAQQQLDGAQISAGLQHMDGKGMAQRVRCDRLGDASFPRAFLQACSTANVEIGCATLA
jgi:hypothetical protein